MNVKKYVGSTMQEAFDAVKRELGPDAIILHTKTRKRNGIMGLLGKEMVEITASSDVNILNEGPRKEKTYLETLYRQPAAKAEEKAPETPPASSPSGGILNYELTEIKSMLQNLVRKSQHANMAHLPDELMDFYMLLVQQQISEDLSREIIQRIHNELRADELRNSAVIRDMMRETLTKLLKNSQPIKLDKPAKKIALIGPTGVGKTTTIAKLAAHFSLKENKKVGLITVDTYRIAAVEQLRTYADIINIPLEIVLTPNELKRALARFKDRDLILVDTAGRSQKNRMQMAELKTYLDVMQPDEVHLVLSLVANYENVMDTIQRFDEIRFDRLLFTKLDEAVNFGLILNVLRQLQKSLSYVTIGQSVPDDIAVGDAGYLAGLILGEKEIS